MTDFITALEKKKKSVAENNNSNPDLQQSSTESTIPQTAQPK
jgi:hypothetical protein